MTNYLEIEELISLFFVCKDIRQYLHSRDAVALLSHHFEAEKRLPSFFHLVGGCNRRYNLHRSLKLNTYLLELSLRGYRRGGNVDEMCTNSSLCCYMEEGLFPFFTEKNMLDPNVKIIMDDCKRPYTEHLEMVIILDSLSVTIDLGVSEMLFITRYLGRGMLFFHQWFREGIFHQWFRKIILDTLVVLIKMNEIETIRTIGEIDETVLIEALVQTSGVVTYEVFSEIMSHILDPRILFKHVSDVELQGLFNVFVRYLDEHRDDGDGTDWMFHLMSKVLVSGTYDGRMIREIIVKHTIKHGWALVRSLFVDYSFLNFSENKTHVIDILGIIVERKVPILYREREGLDMICGSFKDKRVENFHSCIATLDLYVDSIPDEIINTPIHERLWKM